MKGLLLVAKQTGWTSFDAVNYVRKIVAQAEGQKQRQVKVGHTGTLDPLATGLLVLLIGEYTKRASQFNQLDKTYEVTMKLGETSTTADEEGQKTKVSDRRPTLSEVKAVLQQMTGELQQTPPIFSAKKVGGQRAYKLARAGKTVILEPRLVKVTGNDFKSYDYPLVKFISHVSSGTYIRSLVEDIGQIIGTGAYMTELCRTAVGSFQLSTATKVKDITSMTVDSLLIP